MNNNIAIQVQGLGKCYKIGQGRQNYKTFREALTQSLGKIGKREKKAESENLWALKNVSFEIEKGETVGVIGRNGAGKSTLLKILSRITEPTEGEVNLYGRVSSLLEVGTGFHPELTGRENIYLNSAILGMSRREINSKFDQIVEFSELDKFIDTPVKHYSSGMYMRLAFAVAAYLEPDILLVDEVLAVGDAAFQQKCLGKLKDVARGGRTVLFVSHNLQAIQQLCRKAFLFDSGKIIASGNPAEVVSAYLESAASVSWDFKPVQLSPEFFLAGISLTQEGSPVFETINHQKPFQIRIQYDLAKPLTNLLLGFDLYASDGTHLFRSYDMQSAGGDKREPGSYESLCEMPANFFKSSDYFLHLIVGIHRVQWLSYEKIRIRIPFSGLKTTDVTFPGVLQSAGQWKLTRLS